MPAVPSPQRPAHLPILLKPQPQLSPAQAERYKQRTMVERVFGRLRDEFGAGRLRVRGAQKVMAHLMFGVLTLTVDQLLRLHPQKNDTTLRKSQVVFRSLFPKVRHQGSLLKLCGEKDFQSVTTTPFQRFVRSFASR
ncbi:MAG: transposase [Acidobacteriota bacterium]